MNINLNRNSLFMTDLCVTGGSGFIGEHLSQVEIFRSALFAGRNRPKFAENYLFGPDQNLT